MRHSIMVKQIRQAASTARRAASNQPLTRLVFNEDWSGTRVGFKLQEDNGATEVRFHHFGWREPNDHYQTSCYCWAMYLRLLRRYVETGATVEYERRLDA